MQKERPAKVLRKALYDIIKKADSALSKNGVERGKALNEIANKAEHALKVYYDEKV